MVRFVLNILWALFGGGLVLAIEYVLAGLLCCITVIGIPFGLQCFKIAGLALFPFGKDFEPPIKSGVGGGLANLIWFLFAGLWICLTHLAAAVPLAVSVIGIPFAVQHVKLGLLAVFPFGVRVRDAL